MRLNILFFIVVFLSVSFTSFSQNDVSPDSRLYAKYSHEYLTSLSETQPQALEYLNFELDNGFTIIEVEEQKVASMPYLRYFNGKEQGEILIELPDGFFNLAIFEYERKYRQKSTYRIGDDHAIIFDSIEEMTELFNIIHNE